MFTQQELAAQLPRLVAADAPPLDAVEFGQHDFESPSSEQCIRAFRGLKQDFASGLLFWVKTLQSQGWEGREAYFIPYAEAGRCKPITASEFAELVAEFSGSVRRSLPPYLCELSGFRSGLQMFADWNEVAAVAELEDAFIAFYWTTAS